MYDLPLYRVTLADDDEPHDIRGFPECRQYGALFFTNTAGDILKLFAPGSWKEVTRIEGVGAGCEHCGRLW